MILKKTYDIIPEKSRQIEIIVKIWAIISGIIILFLISYMWLIYENYYVHFFLIYTTIGSPENKILLVSRNHMIDDLCTQNLLILENVL